MYMSTDVDAQRKLHGGKPTNKKLLETTTPPLRSAYRYHNGLQQKSEQLSHCRDRVNEMQWMSSSVCTPAVNFV